MPRSFPEFETKADWVVSELRSAVRSGQLAPGERVRIADWAQRLGVSETPMREAVKVLAAEGALTIEAHKGARVTSFSSGDFLEFSRVLGTLEGIAVELATEKLDASERAATTKRLKQYLEDLSESVKVKDVDTWVQANRAFHATFDELSRSTILKSAITPLRDMFPVADMSLAQAVLSSKKLLRELLNEYEAVIASFEAGDAVGASAAMARHVVWFLDLVGHVYNGTGEAAVAPVAGS